MKKIISLLMFVLAVVLVFKFLTSTFFIWLVFGAAAPQVIRYLCFNGVITKRGAYRNAYKYTAYVIIALTVLRLIFAHTIGISALLGGLIGVAISEALLHDICK